MLDTDNKVVIFSYFRDAATNLDLFCSSGLATPNDILLLLVANDVLPCYLR